MAASEKNSISRRDVVGAAGASLAVAASSSASAKGEAPMTTELQDPTTKYPKPPFKKQSQPWPGLASKMDPPPGPRREELSRLGPARGPQGADHRRRFRHGPRRRHRLCARGRRCRHQLSARRGARRARGHRADQGRGPHRRSRIPGDLRDEAFCQQLVAQAVQGLGGLDIVVNNAGAAADAAVDPRHLDRGFRRDDEDQHLRAVLDHQGGAAASEARLRASSAPPRSRPTIRRRICTTMRRPRRRR